MVVQSLMRFMAEEQENPKVRKSSKQRPNRRQASVPPLGSMAVGDSDASDGESTTSQLSAESDGEARLDKAGPRSRRRATADEAYPAMEGPLLGDGRGRGSPLASGGRGSDGRCQPPTLGASRQGSGGYPGGGLTQQRGMVTRTNSEGELAPYKPSRGYKKTLAPLAPLTPPAAAVAKQTARQRSRPSLVAFSSTSEVLGEPEEARAGPGAGGAAASGRDAVQASAQAQSASSPRARRRPSKQVKLAELPDASEEPNLASESQDRKSCPSRTAPPRLELSSSEAPPEPPVEPRPGGSARSRRRCRTVAPPSLAGLDVEERRPEGQAHISWPRAKGEQAVEDSLEYRPRIKFLIVLSSPTATVSEYVQAIAQEVGSVLLSESCSVFFVDDVRQEIWSVGPGDTGVSESWDNGVVGLAARQGAQAQFAGTAVIPTMSDPVLDKAVGTIRSLLVVPIRHVLDQNRIIGVIAALNKLGGPTACFSEGDVAVLQSLARLASDSFYRMRWKALESTHLREDTEALSLISQTMPFRAPSRRPCTTPSSGSAKLDNLSERLSWVEVPLEPRTARLSRMRTLGFDALECSPDELTGLVELVMQHTGCLERCAVPVDRLHSWASAAKRMYRDNPFHNWFHGFSVFQMCYYQLYVSPLKDVFSMLDVFGLLIAALCHDLDHPGFNNSYMVDSSSELALRHNDIAVLENHHASLACDLLRRDATAIGAGLDRAAQTALRRVIIKSILDTDMAHHSEMCQKLVASSEAEDRQLMLGACIHSADLSAQVLPWKIAQQWEERISLEFSRQAAEEVSAGRTPAQFMSFKMDDLSQRGKLQRDFCDFVLLPLWDPYTQIMPSLRMCYRNLVKNRSFYDHRWVHGTDPDAEWCK